MNPQAPRPRVFTNRRRFFEHGVVGLHEAIETHFTECIVSVELKLECGPIAQHDGCPAKYRWRPQFRRKVWLTPTSRCRAVTLPRRETS